MILEPERYPYLERGSQTGMLSLMPLLPFSLSKTASVTTLGLRDTGSSINILPFGLGLKLGGIWEDQSVVIPLSGGLAAVEARGIVLFARVGNFPLIELAFAWARSDSIPILLGQVNFFLEFDVCFHRSLSFFEICPKQHPSSATPD